jgi:hypothetical protein
VWAIGTEVRNDGRPGSSFCTVNGITEDRPYAHRIGVTVNHPAQA